MTEETTAVSEQAAALQGEPVSVALTGASGAQYGLRLIECLVAVGRPVYVMISRAAQVVIATETDVKIPSDVERAQQKLTGLYGAVPGQIRVFSRDNWFAPVASGSGSPSATVVCPCSTGSLSAFAVGASDNLIERAVDVALKERRKLILVPREAPYSEIHLEHMLKLTRMGAVVIPASPGFYHKPDSVEAMIDFVVARILDQLGIDQQLMPRWGSER
ncbi:UbiX family flavin prenyltransferase [Motiliproteus coralliicola]|uniref:Flavin prenyltransferase UbiX n=1 Tax=Motiliproteus coralliicola TaxID=2283196 RepID=A0A369WH34_9GAMM|nr:UbiX family flavin prenyltransferase [Motiliproteus coralliicola]